MTDGLDDRIRALMAEVDRVAPPPPEFAAIRAGRDRNRTARPALRARVAGRPSRRRRLAAVVSVAVIVAGGVVLVTRQAGRGVSTIHPNPGTSAAPSATVTSIGNPATTGATPSSNATGVPASTTATTAGATATPLIVHPFGVRSDVVDIGVIDANITTQAAAVNPGDVVLTYELQIGFDPAKRNSTIEPATATSDGQLAIETGCATPGCLDVHPVNDQIQTTVELTVRRTTVPLTAGEHTAPFAIHFTDGTTENFTVGLYAEPAPSAAVSTRVTSLGGPPTAVQTVFDVGHFGYHMISAFGSIWTLSKAFSGVVRVDAVTGAVTATIPIRYSSNRLTATADAVYVTGDPVLRIDPATNTISPVTTTGLTVNSTAIIADGPTLWTASITTGIHRIAPDGTVTTVPLPSAGWIDLAVSHGMIWALGQDPGGARLIAFDATTGTLDHDLTIPTGDRNGLPVRLVADERNVVVGIDPRTGGTNGFGSNGELVIVDPTTATITATVPLATRPEGIIITDRHIWTSGAVLDRATLTITPVNLGFTITRGPDGSIWATTSIPGTIDAATIAIRFAPGNAAG